MSNFHSHARHPKTGEVEMAEFLDNHFGPREYGVRFPSDGTIVREDGLPDNVATVATPKEKNCRPMCLYENGNCANSACRGCHKVASSKMEPTAALQEEIAKESLKFKSSVEELVRELIVTLQYGVDLEGEVDETSWKNQPTNALTPFEAKIRIDCWDAGFESGIESERTRLHAAIEGLKVVHEGTVGAAPRERLAHNTALTCIQDLLSPNK